MFGAVYGDVIGSYYESCCTKRYNFPFQISSSFTDDTVMTVAVCKAILYHPEPIGFWQIGARADEYGAQYRRYYSCYPDAGFGKMFSDWAKSGSTKRNHSYANGGAMRVVPIGYAYDCMEQVLRQARASCLPSHSHPEAIRGAQSVAAAVFLAKNGESKASICKYLQKKFHYDLSVKYSELKERHVFNCRASYSVPAALIAFLESSDYESAVRNAVSLGGDADTEACIAGGIAEAYYGRIPKAISDFCNLRIDYTLKKVLFEFRDLYCKS